MEDNLCSIQLHQTAAAAAADIIPLVVMEAQEVEKVVETILIQQ
tara:strand:+ start:251 stop:382 length:132 start_codon:yes stop_codon:yes gene_type:complete